MKKRIVGLIVLAALALAGCGQSRRDSEVNAFMADVDQVTADIVRKINSDPSASGIDEAQKILDTKRAELKTRYDKLKELTTAELSDEVMKKFTDSVSRDLKALADLQSQHAEKVVGDEAFSKKMNKLYADYNSIFGV